MLFSATTLGPTPTPYEIDGIFADCSASIPPSVIYSGPAEPIRQGKNAKKKDILFASMSGHAIFVTGQSPILLIFTIM